MGINENRIIGMATRVGLVILLATGFLWITTWAEDPPVTESFELGDGVDPTTPGTADVLGSTVQNGPDWDDLFDADRQLRGVLDEFGNAGSNGVPDILDAYGVMRTRRDAVFVLDDISAGSAVDQTTFTGTGVIGAGTVDPANDLGNAYAYTAFNDRMSMVLYAGLERLAPGVGRIDLEFNQAAFSVEPDGSVTGARTAGDLQLGAIFTAGVLTAIETQTWTVLDPETGAGEWTAIETLPVNPEDPAEQCNLAGSLCALCNSTEVDGGAWPNYGADGSTTVNLGADAFLEIGVNVTDLLGSPNLENYYDTRFVSMQLTTYDSGDTPAAQDYALGQFVRASRLINR